MLELVTIEQAREHLRLDGDSSGGADDAWLMIFIPAISEAVALWLKQDFRLYEWAVDSAGDYILDSAGDPTALVDSSGDPVIRYVVKAAVLVELAYQYRYREGEGDHTATGDLYSGRYGYILSRGATALLQALRKPTVR